MKERGGSSAGMSHGASVRFMSVMRHATGLRPWKSQASGIALSESFAIITAASVSPLAAAT